VQSDASLEAWLLLTDNYRVRGFQLTQNVINVTGLKSSREGEQSSSLWQKVSLPETV